MDCGEQGMTETNCKKEEIIETCEKQRMIELDEHISYLQQALYVKKDASHAHMRFKYWTYENIILELKPHLIERGLRFILTQAEIITIPCNTTVTRVKDGITNTKTTDNRLFLKMGLSVRYKGVETTLQYGYTDITVSQNIMDSSQAFGAHATYLKKRLYADFLLTATNDSVLDSDLQDSIKAKELREKELKEKGKSLGGK